MAKYDAVRFSPPAPVASVELRQPGTTNAVSDVPMLLDTGADITLLPRNYIDRLQISFDPSQIYDLEVVFVGLVFRGRFPVIDQPEGILGRNILNHLNLALNRSEVRVGGSSIEATGMKKNGDRLLTWEEMLLVEDQHPFSAGNLRSLRMGSAPFRSERSNSHCKDPNRKFSSQRPKARLAAAKRK